MAPPLSAVKDITDDFEVSTDSLAGEVQGDTKIFSQTIRPLRESVQEIPAIPFGFFNPRTESYETAWTDPIPLRVRPAERVAVGPVGDNTEPQTGEPAQAEPITVLDGLQANHADIDAMLANHGVRIGVATYTVLGGLPALYAAGAVVLRRRRRLRDDARLRRRTQAQAGAKKRLEAAESSGRVEDVLAALLTYIADRSNEPVGGLTRREAGDRLERHGVDAALRRDVDDLLAMVEQSAYGGQAGVNVKDAAAQARSLIARLERAMR